MGTWVGQTAAAIAAAVRDGSATAQQVVREHLEQIEKLDREIGAFVRVRRERSESEAEALSAHSGREELPLAGVPIAIKDNIPVAGEPTRCGSLATPHTPAATDHEVVRRLRAAGAVVVGLTRLPELGVWGVTEDATTVTRNPWALDLTAGGSSGGSAAAVSAAMVPAAHGNDGLGSIRIPAACCGLVGIKPGAGVVPAGLGRTSWRGLAENGALATTVQDAALMLSVMADRPDLAAVTGPGRPLRIAASTQAPLPGLRVDPEIQRTVVDVALTLRDAGHQVQHTDPPISTGAAAALIAWYVAGTADEAAGLDQQRLEPRQRRHAQLGRTALRLGRVRELDRDRWKQRAAELFATVDLLLTPVLTGLPLPAAGWRERSWAANFWANARWAPFSGAWNFAQYPAATVPAARHSRGLPIGIQLVAAPGGEALLLSVARQLETLRPWPRHAPAARV